MKTLPRAALLAATFIITAITSNAFCQNGLQTLEAPPANLQAVSEWAGDASEGACGDCQSCSNGCNTCYSGPQGCLANAAAGLSSMAHSGQPLIDPWARADWIAAQRAATQSWHAGYYHTAWGAPVALVVPPTARMQTRMGWGVSQTAVTPIYQQFERPYPGGMTAQGETAPGTLPLRPTPRWPSHTDQFGVYYVRGPW